MKSVIRDVAEIFPGLLQCDFEKEYPKRHPYPDTLTPQKIAAAWSHYQQLTRQKKRKK